jgi:PAS domain S-box-containing protein
VESQIVALIVSAAATALLWWYLSFSARGKIAGLHSELTALTTELEVCETRTSKLARALDAAKIVVWEVDAAAPEVKRNPLSCQAARGGCPIAFADPDANLDTVHPDDREALLAHRLAVQAGTPTTQAEFRVVSPSGAVSHLLTLATRTGEATTVGVNIEVSAMREAEKERQLHRERVRRASDAAQDCFYEVDLSTGKLWIARPYHVDILGYPPSSAREPPSIEGANMLHHPDDHRVINETIWEHLIGKTPLFEFEYRIRAFSGEWVWFSNKGAAMRNEAGQALHLSGVTREISDKKAFQRGLIEAREAAAAANRAKGEFLANMSHEIRTPMNGVIGMTDLLLDTHLEPTQREYAETVRDCSKSLLAVINDVLDFSKLEAKKLDLEIIDLDLHAVIATVQRQLAALARDKGLDLTLQLDPALPIYVRGDPGRIQQILHSLGSNAVKFTEQGSVSIDIRLVEHKSDGVRIRCEVRDTGVGIPSERLDTLFEPFSQVDASSTRKHGGAGLGLCIMRRLVELMDGEAGVTSRVGEGSCFWFTAQFAVSSGRQPRVLSSAARLRGRRILVADDNAVNRKLTVRSLEKLGCRADAVPGGREAIAAWEGGQYDLILMDCQMPDIDGFEAARQIRRREAGKQRIPIIALTAEVTGAIAGECAAAGMDHTLAKPIERKILEDTLSRYFADAQPTSRDRPDEGS